MPGITINSNLSNVREAFRLYVAENKRDQEVLWVDQSRKMATELYKATAEIAPTKAEIAAEVKALGWHIPTRFQDDRLGRGYPSQWGAWALAKRDRLIRRRGRKTKKDQLSASSFLAQKPTLAQMQQFVIGRRSKARLYLASGWLGAILDLGGSPSASSGIVSKDRGGAIVQRSPGQVAVTFWNKTKGIETMDKKKGFVALAIARRVADMLAYVTRKRGGG